MIRGVLGAKLWIVLVAAVSLVPTGCSLLFPFEGEPAGPDALPDRAEPPDGRLDGDTVDGSRDGSERDASPSVCGDGKVEGREQCDDGNTRGGDGCSAQCQTEANWNCRGEPSHCSPCGDGWCTVADGENPDTCSEDCAVKRISAGLNHTCALLADDTIWCWGANTFGQLGDGTTTSSSIPVPVLVDATRLKATAVSAGGSHTCAIDLNHVVYCWGRGDAGQLGTGSQADSLTPVPVSASTGLVSAAWISCGDSFTCAVDSGHGVWCWGADGAGRLGNGSAGESSVPDKVVVRDGGPQLEGVGVAAGLGYHACAWTGDNAVYCWGANGKGQLGTGGIDTSAPLPQLVLGSGDQGIRFRQAATGSAHSCGVVGRNAYCWGRNEEGQLGAGTDDASAPRQVLLENALYVSAGMFHTCATTSDATGHFGLWCWGDNSHGQLGDGTHESATVPIAVVNLAGERTVTVSAGATHTCTASLEGRAWCWGSNRHGQLGNGTTTDSSVPVLVVFQ